MLWFAFGSGVCRKKSLVGLTPTLAGLDGANQANILVESKFGYHPAREWLV